MTSPAPVTDIFDALPSRRGHFALESGYHTDLWITLDALFVDPASLAPHVARSPTACACTHRRRSVGRCSAAHSSPRRSQRGSR